MRLFTLMMLTRWAAGSNLCWVYVVGSRFLVWCCIRFRAAITPYGCNCTLSVGAVGVGRNLGYVAALLWCGVELRLLGFVFFRTLWAMLRIGGESGVASRRVLRGNFGGVGSAQALPQNGIGCSYVAIAGRVGSIEAYAAHVTCRAKLDINVREKWQINCA